MSRKLRVAFVSQPIYFRFHYEQDLNSTWETKEFDFHFNMNREDLQELIEFDADVNFFFRGEHVPDEVLDNLRGTKIGLSTEIFPKFIEGRLLCTKSSLERYLHFRKIRCKSFDYVFHYEPCSLEFMANDGLELSGSFPLPIATNTIKPEKMEKRWDICFVGRSSSHREHLFGQLKHDYKFFHLAHGLWGRELLPYFHHSKILINAHAQNEISWEPRVQYLLATGGCLVSEQITPNDLLVPGQDYEEFRSRQQLERIVKRLLSDEDRRAELAKNGREKIVSQLSTIKKFPELIADIEAGKYPRFKATPPNKLLSAFGKGHRMLGEKAVINQLNSQWIGHAIKYTKFTAAYL